MAKIYGQLERAQVQNLASDPGSPPLGLIWYNTTDNVFKIKNNAGVQIITDRASAETLTNKNLSDSTTNFVDATDATVKVAVDAAGSAGTKTTLRAVQTVDRIVTLPDAATTLLGHDTAQVVTNKDIDGGTAANTRRITIPSAAYATLSGLTRKAATILYATDQTKLYLDTGSILTPFVTGSSVPLSVATKSSAYTLTSTDDIIRASAASAYNLTLPAATDVPGKRFIVQKTDNNFNVITVTDGGSFSTTVNSIDERVVIVSDGTAYFVDDRKTDTVPRSITPTGNWTDDAVVDYSGKWHREGKYYCGDYLIVVNSGTIAGTTGCTFDLPSGVVIDTASMVSAVQGMTILGEAGLDNSGAYFVAKTMYSNTTRVALSYLQQSNVEWKGVTKLAPFTFAAADQVWVNFKVPVVGWNA